MNELVERAVISKSTGCDKNQTLFFLKDKMAGIKGWVRQVISPEIEEESLGKDLTVLEKRNEQFTIDCENERLENQKLKHLLETVNSEYKSFSLDQLRKNRMEHIKEESAKIENLTVTSDAEEA